MVGWRALGGLGVVVALCPGCRALNPDFDEPVVSSSSGSDSVVEGSAGSVDPDSVTSAGTSSAGSTGGSSSALDDSTATGPPGCEDGSCLVDRGLVTRYFIDEADAGQRPVLLRDSAPLPLDLVLEYESDPEPEMFFVEEPTGRALDWSMAGYDSRASVLADSTKLVSELDGSTTATIEVVLRMTDVHDMGSRISHIGDGSESGWLSLSSTMLGVLRFHWHGSVMLEEWNIGGSIIERHVVHVVVDTNAPAPDDRVLLYLDGEAFPPTSNQTAPGRGEPILIDVGRYYVLGNRQIGGRSFQGRLYYAALYSSALSAGEVAANAQNLLTADDS